MPTFAPEKSTHQQSSQSQTPSQNSPSISDLRENSISAEQTRASMREQIMKRAGSATVGIEAQSSVDRSSGSESELSYQRSRTVVPVTPAQGATGQHQQPLMGKDVSGAAPATGVQNFSGSHSPEIGRSGAVTPGFDGIYGGPGKNFVSDGISFIRQSPPPQT